MFSKYTHIPRGHYLGDRDDHRYVDQDFFALVIAVDDPSFESACANGLGSHISLVSPADSRWPENQKLMSAHMDGKQERHDLDQLIASFRRAQRDLGSIRIKSVVLLRQVDIYSVRIEAAEGDRSRVVYVPNPGAFEYNESSLIELIESKF